MLSLTTRQRKLFLYFVGSPVSLLIMALFQIYYVLRNCSNNRFLPFRLYIVWHCQSVVSYCPIIPWSLHSLHYIRSKYIMNHTRPPLFPATARAVRLFPFQFLISHDCLGNLFIYAHFMQPATISNYSLGL